MTPAEFIVQYLQIESRRGCQLTLLDTVQKQLDDIEASEAELATTHLEDLTELRAGQAIEIASMNGFGNPDWNLPCTATEVVEVMQADVADLDLEIIGGMTETAMLNGSLDLESAVADIGIQIEITVWIRRPGLAEPDSLVLEPHPGAQWRYPEAAQTVTIGGGKEAA